MRLNPDKEKELRKYCSLEMQAALAEIDYLRSCLLDMEFVRGERDEYKRQAHVFSTARDRWMESSDKYKQLSQGRENRIAKLRHRIIQAKEHLDREELEGRERGTADYRLNQAILEDDLEAGKE